MTKVTWSNSLGETETSPIFATFIHEKITYVVVELKGRGWREFITMRLVAETDSADTYLAVIVD